MRTFIAVASLILSAGSCIAQETAGPCPVFPETNPWNVEVWAYPVHPQSETFIRSIDLGSTTKRLHADFGTVPEYGIPYVYVGASQPPVPITYDAYGDESDPGPFPIPPDAPVEGAGVSQGDRHVIVVDTAACTLYELFAARKDATGTGWTAESGAVFDLSTNSYRPDGWTSADAAGLPVFPGLVRYEEIEAGAIEHALRFTSRYTQRGWIHPARHQAGRDDTSYPPMGLRLRLRADYDISGVTGQSRIILEALKLYGMILADNGTSWFISGTSDPRWDVEDLNQLKRVPGTAFEAVYTGEIKTRPELSAVEATDARDAIARVITTTEEIIVELDVAMPGPHTLALYDAHGALRAAATTELGAGRQTIHLDRSSLESGLYALRIASNQATLHRPIVITN